MPKGAKKGENRFIGTQTKSKQFRLNRIDEVVVPKLNTLVGKVKFEGKTPFCKVCAEYFNENLPVNESKIGYRTFEQNLEYWEKVGAVYFRYWASDPELHEHRERVQAALMAKESSNLKEQNKRLTQENEALRAALRAHGAEAASPKPTSDAPRSSVEADDFDRVCRALKLVIDASEEIFELDKDEMQIISNLTDLNPKGGLVPKSLAEPFFEWLRIWQGKSGGQL